MSSTAHVLHVFPSFVPGGSQVRTTALMAALGPDFRHSVMSMDGQRSALEMLPEGFPLGFVEAPPKGGFFGTLRALAKRIEDSAPDLICTYNWGAIETVLAARSLGKPPVIHHEDGFGPDEAAGLKRRRTWTRRLALKRASSVVVPSHNLGRIATRKWKLPSWVLHVVPNGIDLARFEPRRGQPAAAALRAALGIDAAAFVVGSVGHLRAEKNYPRLVAAVAEAQRRDPERDWQLLLVGDGPEREAVERAAREAGLTPRVHLVGHQEDCAPALRAMDAFALSSDTEQMPISLVEAMASGRPAASMDVGDVRLMLPEQADDLIVPLKRGAEGLAEALVGLAQDPERSAHLAQLGRAKALAEYGFDAMLASYRELYTRALE